MSKHSFFPSDSPQRRRALDKANNRGKIAVEWFKTNKLTPETQPEFNALMKKADKEFDRRK
jgi:hypothetical protein